MKCFLLIFGLLSLLTLAGTLDILNNKYDYVIVGGGTAGCVLAARLSENTRMRVLLLEAGEESTDPFKMVPRTAFTHWTEPNQNWFFETEPQKYLIPAMERRITWQQARELGGCSNHNIMLYNRCSRHDFDRWEELGNVGWNYSSVLPYLIKMEEMTDKPAGSTRGMSGPIKVKFAQPLDLTDQFIKAGVEAGSVYNPDQNNGDPEGYGNIQYNVDRTGRRSSTLVAYLKPVMHRHNLFVVKNALVTKILMKKSGDKTIAKGVKVQIDGVERKVFAKREVIVSAGTVNSAKLLLLSGIGPKEHLQALEIKVRKNLPVGSDVRSHVAFVFQLDVDPKSPLKMEKIMNFETLFQYVYTGKGLWSVPFSGAFAFYRSEGQPSEHRFPYLEQMYTISRPLTEFPLPFPDLVDSVRNGSVTIEQIKELQNAEEKPSKVSVYTGHLHPRTIGSIRLRSTNPTENPVLDYQYFEDEADLEDLVYGVRVTQDLIKTSALRNAGIKPVTSPIPGCMDEGFDTDQYWKCYIRRNIFPFEHHTGSCRMDPGPNGVVDSNLRVKGVEKLRVVDGSIIPLTTSGHTHVPIIMVAEKAADIIKQNQ